MRSLKNHLVLLLYIALVFACNTAKKDSSSTSVAALITEISSPQEALDELKKGNQRFLSNMPINTNYEEQIDATKELQKPHSLILTCMDSRVPPEIIFDQGIGNIFVVRNAGNLQDEIVLGSMEYAVKFAGSKLIVVMGHSHCGAVKGAIGNVQSGNLTQLVDKIKPCIPVDSDGDDLVDETAKNNVQQTIQQIIENSETIRELLSADKIAIVSAFYDIETGAVSF